MQDKATGHTLVFAFDRWFSRDMDDHDLVRELPAVKDNKPVSKGGSVSLAVYVFLLVYVCCSFVSFVVMCGEGLHFLFHV